MTADGVERTAQRPWRPLVSLAVHGHDGSLSEDVLSTGDDDSFGVS